MCTSDLLGKIVVSKSREFNHFDGWPGSILVWKKKNPSWLLKKKGSRLIDTTHPLIPSPADDLFDLEVPTDILDMGPNQWSLCESCVGLKICSFKLSAIYTVRCVGPLNAAVLESPYHIYIFIYIYIYICVEARRYVAAFSLEWTLGAQCAYQHWCADVCNGVSIPCGMYN